MKNIQFIVSVRAIGNTCHSFHFLVARIYIKIHIYIYHGHFEEKNYSRIKRILTSRHTVLIFFTRQVIF